MLDVMDVALFKDLERLSLTGNFTQAAEQAHLSQPAFSRRIKTLESWVGVTLVDRSRQPVTLTPAGARMLEAGLLALSRIESERSQILRAQSLPDRQIVTFGTQHSIGWRFFPTWIHALETSYGPLLTRLRADDLPNCLRDLRAGDVDFVIAYLSTGTAATRSDVPRGVDSVPIGADRLIAVCKPRADGAPLFTFDDPGDVPFLRYGDGAPIGAQVEGLLGARALHGRLRTVYENSMTGALRIRARDGAGVAWLPESLVDPDIATGLLVRTGAPAWTVYLDICLLRNRARTNRVTRSIWAHLASGPPPDPGGPSAK